MKGARFIKSTILVPACLMLASYVYGEGLIDYEKLSHSIQLDSFRSGNHDPDGIGEYLIKVKYFAILNTEAERKKDWAQQKKIAFDGPEFNELHLENLSFWKPSKDEKKAMRVEIKGDQIRKACSEAMNKLGIKENEISLMVRISVVETGKKYFFIDDSHEILSTQYYPIPQTKYDIPMRTNQNLIIKDDNATRLTFSVVYDENSGELANSTEGK
ncbi:hypothetical protein N9D31_02925 [Oligoflexaceae bacterium]|nr:hypothetical protein [Oligoflexaceae bacterium]